MTNTQTAREFKDIAWPTPMEQAAEINRLAAENQRLREALEFIGYTQNIQAANDTARAALGVTK